MGAMSSQIISLMIVYLTVYSGADQRKHQISASLAFVREIPRWQVNSPHKWPVTPKMFPVDDVIMINQTQGGAALRFITYRSTTKQTNVLLIVIELTVLGKSTSFGLLDM